MPKTLIVSFANAIITFIVCMVLASLVPQLAVLAGYAILLAVVVFFLTLVGAIPLWWR